MPSKEVKMTTSLQSKIREHLDRNGYTVAGFERMAGLKTNVLRNILTGQSVKPTVQTLQMLAKAMDCSVPALLDKDEPPLQGIAENSVIVEESEMLIDALRTLLSVAAKHGRKLSFYKICLLLDEIYTYALQRHPPSVDEAFVNWLLMREMKGA